MASIISLPCFSSEPSTSVAMPKTAQTGSLVNLRAEVETECESDRLPSVILVLDENFHER